MKIKQNEKEKSSLKNELIKIAEMNPATGTKRAKVFFTADIVA